MSQIPTNSDIPSNSKKAQEAAIRERAQQSAKPEIVPFDGDVAGAKRKKSGFWAWFKKMFLSDRKPSEIVMDVIENNIVPGIKDNTRNAIVSSLDMFIYQSAKAPTASNSNGINYNNLYRSNAYPSNPKPAPQPQAQQSVDLSGGFVNPCFKTRIEAERFLNGKMKAYDYPTLSVHTMYMMMSKHIDYTWDAYGWTKEEVASWDPNRIITHVNSTEYPWMIDLPQAHVIS